MNENINDSLSNKKSSPEISQKDAVTSTENHPIQHDEPTPATNSTSREQHGPHSGLSVSNYFNAFKSYVLSSEDDADIRYTTNKEFDYIGTDREPMFVIVDSSCVSNPSSKELLVDGRYNTRDTVLKKHYNKNVKPVDIPSTSRDLRNEILPPQLKESESTDEMQMIDINLQSENELSVGDSEGDSDSIVISYLRNKDAFLDMEELSESSLDVFIPSYPASPRSVEGGAASLASLFSSEDCNNQFKQAIEFLHHDSEFLNAADMGDENLLHELIMKGTDIHVKDHLGRNALHFAVVSGNRYAVTLLLDAGVDPNVKDNVGMTPLSLCLMRRPSWRMALMLFNHGAVMVPRCTPMDTGLFLQFVMMCTPTKEEERILHLLVEKGALVNDPDAPGGRQALHFAAMSNNCRLITILVELGADMLAVNHRNETPKEVAATFKCKDAYLILEELEEMFGGLESSSSSNLDITSNIG